MRGMLHLKHKKDTYNHETDIFSHQTE